jgi:simple sugar transport system ATP-binding protein
MTAEAGLHVGNVTKRYGALVALDAIDATFFPGEIHAVLGENGAGKSTLMGILTGFITPDSGTVTYNGAPIPVGRAFECKQLGIEMIHQHFTLVSAFTVAENLALARLPSLYSLAHVRERATPSLSAADRLGWAVDPEARVRDLSVGALQRIEILKALGGDARVLVFDEPTAVLAPDEVEDLFRVLRQLRDEGRIIVLIAHKLSEVMAVADRVTVLRKGKWIASSPLAETNESQLATWMVGELPDGHVARSSVGGQPGILAKGLSVKGDRGEDAVRNVSFQIRRGEIVGFGGVDGNGQVELAEALLSIRARTGDITFAGVPVSPDHLRIAYIPQDRQTDGLAMGMSIEDNLLVTGHRNPALRRGPLLVAKRVHAWARSLVQRFGIKASSPEELVSSLSGGNQQKVVVSRALESQPDLLIVLNPTRGLDIKATEYVHEKMIEARNGGAAIALFTTDLDELYALADRVLFLSRGELREEGGAAALVGASR